jgi:hypothetical protein
MVWDCSDGASGKINNQVHLPPREAYLCACESSVAPVGVDHIVHRTTRSRDKAACKRGQ